MLCTRRAGKSFGIAKKLLKALVDTPGASALYLGLTGDSVMRIMMKDILRVLDVKYKMNARFNKIEKSMTLGNGSVLYLVGADSKPDEMDKILGQKYKLVVIDEAASFKQDVRKLVYEILLPAVSDYEGSIVLAGTPSQQINTLFHHVTIAKVPGWSRHEWSTFDNPHMAAKWEKQIKILLEQNPNVIHTAAFKRMYKAEWVIDNAMKCYDMPESGFIDELPPSKHYRYMLGVDFGWRDATAFIVLAINRYDLTKYIVEAYKEPKLNVTKVADKIKYYKGRYGITKIVVDNASAQVVGEINQIHRIHTEAADKKDKSNFMKIMSSEMQAGNIKIVKGLTSLYAQEIEELVYLDEELEDENPSCENHCCDAALYIWKYCNHYIQHELQKDVPHQNSPEWEEYIIKKREGELAKKLREEKEYEQQYGTETW